MREGPVSPGAKAIATRGPVCDRWTLEGVRLTCREVGARAT